MTCLKRFSLKRVMRRSAGFLLVAAAIAIAASSGRAAGEEVRSELRVQVGDKAPDFALTASNGKLVRLSDFAGRNVLLDFYRAHW